MGVIGFTSAYSKIDLASFTLIIFRLLIIFLSISTKSFLKYYYVFTAFLSAFPTVNFGLLDAGI